ncbi:hypothetical protein CC79DRAFT_1372925 [Sarocladium strictum]
MSNHKEQDHPQDHHVVFLEAGQAPKTDLDFAHTCTRFEHTSPAQVIDHLKDATIAVAGTTPITPADLDQAPRLECVAITATGFEWLDRAAFAERGITVVNCPQSNVEAVGEHFLALYFASRKRVVQVHNAVVGPEKLWLNKGSLVPLWRQGPPLGLAQETLGIIGYGSLGHHIERLARGVGFKEVLIAERKGQTDPREGRATFDHVIQTATTIVICCPKDPSTINLISKKELDVTKPELLLLNLSRGGVVCEESLAATLREGSIFGAATDVFETEPGGIGTSPLLPDVTKGQPPVPNLTVSSHVAWFSRQTQENLVRLLKLGIEGFVRGTLLEPESRFTVIVHQGQVLR